MSSLNMINIAKNIVKFPLFCFPQIEISLLNYSYVGIKETHRKQIFQKENMSQICVKQSETSK